MKNKYQNIFYHISFWGVLSIFCWFRAIVRLLVPELRRDRDRHLVRGGGGQAVGGEEGGARG